tara:strand:+ start:19106 stop:21046 length:1941 start_codon:yes stop_codon:yes gene_type:complete
MRLSIISNCQKDSLAVCIDALNHGFEIDTYMIHEVMADLDQLHTILNDSAFIFAHTPLRSVVPAEMAHKVTYFPNIAFSAYHPDLTFARACRNGGEPEAIFGPLHIYNSAIAVFGYKEGIPLDEILTFYNADSYARLGYFDQWTNARRELLTEGESCGIPLGALFERWSRNQAFMYSSNHPILLVMEDIARELLQRIGMFYFPESKHELLQDPLKAQPIWPIYPEIAERLGLRGSTSFKINDPHGAMDMRDFVRNSYEVFSSYSPETMESLNVDITGFAEKLGLRNARERSMTSGNPYAGADKIQFWKSSVAKVAAGNLDPVVKPKFVIRPEDKVATAGSCFAQHIARTLKSSGFHYFVPEDSPEGMDSAEAHRLNYGVFSARFGNIYTVRQLLQLIERVEGEFSPSEGVWHTKSGSFVDPFRPQIEPDGYVDKHSLEASRQEHFMAVREMLREMDVFVFTLGLTEGWRSKADGAVFPLAPGVAGGAMDEDRYEFINFDVDTTRHDLHKVIAHIKRINPACRIMLTVSPVPLIATYESRHALVSTTYSKAVLRVVADEMWRLYDHVDYFPSYEIITGSYNRGAYFAEDLREVREQGVNHVMGVFMRHYAGAARKELPYGERAHLPSTEARNPLFDVVCDEEAIAKF